MSVVYSNFDHALDKDAVQYLKENPGEEAKHVAWNFCSYIKYDEGKFKAEVWRYNSKVASLESEDIESLISETNDTFGAC